MSEERLDSSGHQNFVKVQSESGAEDVHFSIFCGDLPKDMIENGLRELNETEENRTKGIERLKEFLKKKQLTCADDDLLLAVLRNCKYNIKKSENKLERLLQTRQMVGRRLARVPISMVEEVLNAMSIGILPYRDKHGRIIVFIRPILQVRSYDTEFLVAVLLSCVMFVLSLPMSSVLGTVYIGDSENASLFLMYPYMKLYKPFTMNVFDIPLRIRRVDVLNENFVCRWIYGALRVFLPRKLAERVSFLGSGYKKLHETYHPDILPEDFGGNLGLFNDELYYREKLLNFIQKLKSETETECINH